MQIEGIEKLGWKLICKDKPKKGCYNLSFNKQITNKTYYKLLINETINGVKIIFYQNDAIPSPNGNLYFYKHMYEGIVNDVDNLKKILYYKNI